MKLMDELKTYVSESKKTLEKLELEAKELTDLNRDPEFGDKSRLKAIRKEYTALNSKVSEAEEDVKGLEELETKITVLTDKIAKSRDKLAKELASEKLEDLKLEKEIVEEELTEKYSDILTTKVEEKNNEAEVNNEEQEEKVVESSKKDSSKIAIAAIAVLAALGIGFGGCSLIKSANKDNKKSTDASKQADTTANSNNAQGNISYDSKSNEVTIIDNKTFTDITDTAQVEARAQEVLDEIKTSIPDYEIEIDDIINMINWVNGGVVANATDQECEDMLHLFLNILNNEQGLRVSDNLEAIKNAPEGTEGDITSNLERDLFDYSKLFVDGSRGQKLAQESFEVRKEIFSTIGSAEVNEKSVKLAELLARSAYSLGGAQDLHTVEGNFARLINLFAMFQTRAAADTDGRIIAVINNKEYDIDYVMDALYGECEDSEIDLVSSFMTSAVEEAQSNKDVKTKTLK